MRSTTISVISCLLALTVTAASAETRGDCLAAVQQQQDQIFRQHVDDGVTQAEGNYQKKAQSFGDLSCLDNILNSGADIFFSPPSLGDIVNKMKSAACNTVDTEYNKATAAIGSGTNANLPIGQVIPGVNLGSIGGGFSLQPGESSTLSQNITGNISRTTSDLKSILGN